MQENQIDLFKSKLKHDLGDLNPNSNPHSNFAECLDYEDAKTGKKQIFKCLEPDCGKTFRFHSEMKRHLITHSDKKSYTCNYPGCNQLFKRIDALRSHSKSHADPITYLCEVPGCNSRFNSKKSLNHHILRHGEKSFVCSVPGCNKTFATQAQVKQHEKASFYHQRIVNKASSEEENQQDTKEQIEFLDQPPLNFNENNLVNQPTMIEENTIPARKDPEQIIDLEPTLVKENKLLLLDMVTKVSEENKILQKQLKETEKMMENYRNQSVRELAMRTLTLPRESVRKAIFDYLFNSNESATLR